METLLTKYICEQAAEYREPERAGTRKGDVIGPSSVKFKTALLHLTSLSGVEIAELCGVPYGSFRIWRTEDEYKKLLGIHARDFAQLYVDAFVASIRDNSRWMTLSDGSRAVWTVFDLSRFEDIIIFSGDLMQRIVSLCKGIQLKDEKDPGLVREALKIHGWPMLFRIRKGTWPPREEDGSPSASEEPQELEPQELITDPDDLKLQWEFAELMREPWKAPRQAVREAITLFVKRIRPCL